jgi:hypothetical protein
MGVYMSDLYREICKPVLKLDFTAHGIMESLSELGKFFYKLSIQQGKVRTIALSNLFLMTYMLCYLPLFWQFKSL